VPIEKKATRAKRSMRVSSATVAKARKSAKIAAQEQDFAGEKGRGDSGTHQDTRLGFLMHDITRMRRAILDQMMNKFGVTRAQWWVIAHLSRHDGMTQVQLASILDIGKASLGSLVLHLEEGNFVERRFDPIDKRARRLYLTRKSRQLLDQLHSVEFEFNELALQGVDRQARSQLLALLTLIKANLLRLTSIDGDNDNRHQTPADRRGVSRSSMEAIER